MLKLRLVHVLLNVANLWKVPVLHFVSFSPTFIFHLPKYLRIYTFLTRYPDFQNPTSYHYSEFQFYSPWGFYNMYSILDITQHYYLYRYILGLAITEDIQLLRTGRGYYILFTSLRLPLSLVLSFDEPVLPVIIPLEITLHRVFSSTLVAMMPTTQPRLSPSVFLSLLL